MFTLNAIIEFILCFGLAAFVAMVSYYFGGFGHYDNSGQYLQYIPIKKARPGDVFWFYHPKNKNRVKAIKLNYKSEPGTSMVYVIEVNEIINMPNKTIVKVN